MDALPASGRRRRVLVSIGLAAVLLVAGVAAVAARGGERHATHRPALATTSTSGPPPASPSTSSPNDDVAVRPIVEQTIRARDGRITGGIRADADGRFESIARPSTGAAPPEWRVLWQYTADELASVRAAVDRADAPQLADSYGQGGRVRDAGTATWILRTSSRVATVVVEGFPLTKVTPLDTLFRELQTLHRWPPKT